MLRLSSMSALLERVKNAREISVEAYTLHGALLGAVKAAAQRGASVVVELERHPFHSRGLAAENARVADGLRAAGVVAHLCDRVHAKEVQVDGTLFLDEKNWHMGDIVLSESDPAAARSIPMMKEAALAEEAKLLAGADVESDVIVESESFGNGNPTYDALRTLGKAKTAPRLLVSENDLRTARREPAILRDLIADGVRVRVCADSAKLAVAGSSAWLGSANATYAGTGYNMTDWGVRTNDAAIAETVRSRLEAQWAAGRDLPATDA